MVGLEACLQAPGETEALAVAGQREHGTGGSREAGEVTLELSFTFLGAATGATAEKEKRGDGGSRASGRWMGRLVGRKREQAPLHISRGFGLGFRCSLVFSFPFRRFVFFCLAWVPTGHPDPPVPPP